MANQLKKKFIGNDQVDGNKILLLEGQDIRKIVNGQEVRIIESLEQKIEEEKQSRIAGDLAAVAESKAYTDTKVAEAKAYTDTKVSEAKAEILGGIDDATLDTIKEIADRLKSEETATGAIFSEIGAVRTIAEGAYAKALEVEQGLSLLEESNQLEHQEINTRISGLESQIEQERSRALLAEQFLSEEVLGEKTRAMAEESAIRQLVATETARATEAESEINSRLLSLEGKVINFNKMKMITTAEIIAAGYVELSHAAIANSIVAHYDRQGMFEGDDFSVSVVAGKTRITFLANLVSPSPLALEAGDVLRFAYQYEV